MLNQQGCGQSSTSEINQENIIDKCKTIDPSQESTVRIVNGKIAQAGTLPWQVSSLYSLCSILNLIVFCKQGY